MASVEAHLSRRPSPATPLRVVAHLTQSRGGYRLSLRLDDSERVLEGGSCEDVSRAGALLVALMLEPGLSQEPAQQGERVKPAAPTSAASKVEHSLRVVTGVGALLERGTLPKLNPMGTLALGVVTGPWRFELSANAGLGVEVAVDSQRTLTLRPAWAALRGCFQIWQLKPVALAPCLGVEAGLVRAVAQGVDPPTESTPPVVSGVGEAALSFLLSQNFTLIANGGLALPWVRPRVFVEGPGPRVRAYRAEVGPRVGLGLRIAL